MLPGMTTSPPYFLTPRRCALESRPLRSNPVPSYVPWQEVLTKTPRGRLNLFSRSGGLWQNSFGNANSDRHGCDFHHKPGEPVAVRPRTDRG